MLWQVNIIEPEGFIGALLADPLQHSGVVSRAVEFYQSPRSASVAVSFALFTNPPGREHLAQSTAFMKCVADVQDEFRPDAAGTQLIAEMSAFADPEHVIDNQKLLGLAGCDLQAFPVQPGIDVVFLTGVATNLTVEQTAPRATDPGQTEYSVIDCMAAPTADVHPATLANMEPATRGLLTVAEALAAGTAASTMKEASWAS